MRIEDLVPPLKLCKQIPKGKFKDSALVWCEDEDGLELVMPREIAEFEKEGIPAPTLQEILEDMAVGDEIMESHSPELNYNRFCGGWIIRGRILNISVCDRIFRDWVDERDKTSPATAALKLWLKLNPSEVKS